MTNYEDITPWAEEHTGTYRRFTQRPSAYAAYAAYSESTGIGVWDHAGKKGPRGRWVVVESREAADALLRELYPPRVPTDLVSAAKEVGDAIAAVEAARTRLREAKSRLDSVIAAALSAVP